MLPTYLAALLLAAGGTQAEERPPCPAQPLPPPIALLAPVREPTNAITFSAVPSLEYPRSAWVVRLSRTGFDGPATIEIVRLRAQSDCNRYDIVGEWSASMPAEDFEALGKQVVPLALPAPELFGPGDPLDRIVGLDGTSISVQMERGSWKISADLRNAGSKHDSVSSVFHTLVAQVVPAPDLPTKDWRTIRPSCEQELGAAAAAYRLAELPQSIRDELSNRVEIFGEGMADSDAPLLQTDAPSAEEKDDPVVRFAQAMLVRDIWFVQYEVALFAGVRTASFIRQSDGRYRLSTAHRFGGAACASIRAALAGVTTPGGF